MYIFTLVNWQYFTPEISEIRVIPGISPTKKAAFGPRRVTSPPRISDTSNGGILNLMAGYFGGGFSRIHKLYIQLTKVRISPF